MATISNPDTIREMLENDGAYQGDPVPAVIYSYRGMYASGDDGERFAIFYEISHDDIFRSPHVKNSSIRCLFTNGMVTCAGQEWLEENI